MVSFQLLGSVALFKNGQPLSHFRSQKEAALLIYLAQTGQSHTRELIADLLWDNRTTQQALSNLRTVLARVRSQVGDALLVTRQSLALTPESRQQVDSVILLQQLAEVGQIDSPAKASALQTALDAYRGDFLANFSLPAAPQFDAWVLTTREAIRQQVIAAYHKLADYALTTGDVQSGLATARRWLQVDALDEQAHTLLIRLLLAAGTVREAAAHYDACANLLRAELGIEPPAEMTALIRTALPKPATTPSPATTVRHNLPAVYDQFFGRTTIQQTLHARLDQPWARLVTIVGPGGVGKTRLATTVARNRLHHYRDGVWLVELAEIDPQDEDVVEAIAVEIATALDLRLSGAATPVEQLVSHLQHKQTLLVLDNFEHLLAGLPLVLDLVQRCEGVQLLVTSREALRVRAEWTMALTGLDYPKGDTDDLPSDAVDLFAARHAQQGAIWIADLAAIRQICRRVEGLPLAIELAAALTHELPCQTIAEQLEHGFDTLAASLRDVPQRHATLQVVFAMSWRTLTPALQAQLTRLAVFRGGFTATAAQQIAAADEQALALLCHKSLLAYDEAADRYALHAVVRAYAAEQEIGAVAEPVEATAPTLQKHAHYYLTLLAQHSEPLQKNAPQQSVAMIHPDIDNVRLAWQTGLAFPSTGSGHAKPTRPRNAPAAELVEAADSLSAALTSLSIYYQLRGLAHEAEAVMQNTIRTATAWGATGLALATRAGLEGARFQNRLGRYRAAIETVQTALHAAQQGADRWAEGMGHVLWGEALWRLGEYALATDKLTHALTVAHAIDSTLLVGWCHHHLGVIDDIQSRYAAALDHLQEACAAWRAIDNAQALSHSLNSIGLVYYHQGDLLAAQQAMEQALTLCNQLDNRHLQALLLNNLSIIATELGDYLSAHHYLQLSFEMATANGDLAAQGLIYTSLGKNYRLLGKVRLAIESLEEGLQISESIGNHALTATGLFYLAETTREAGPRRAESLYRQALGIARQYNLQHIECEILIGMAEFLSKENESEARQYSTQAITLAETLQNPNFLKRATAINHYLSIAQI
jgi:predicted ATPase/DNA-binding SARP family transcriptional activator